MTRHKRNLPPTHLSPDAAVWWSAVESQYEFNAADLALLGQAAEVLDRLTAARKQIEADGAYVFVKGVARPHPALRAERQDRVVLARLLRELALPLDDADDARPPRRR